MKRSSEEVWFTVTELGAEANKFTSMTFIMSVKHHGLPKSWVVATGLIGDGKLFTSTVSTTTARGNFYRIFWGGFHSSLGVPQIQDFPHVHQRNGLQHSIARLLMWTDSLNCCFDFSAKCVIHVCSVISFRSFSLVYSKGKINAAYLSYKCH